MSHATATLDLAFDDATYDAPTALAAFDDDARDAGLTTTTIALRGDAGGWPVVRVAGPRAALVRFVVARGYDDDALDA